MQGKPAKATWGWRTNAVAWLWWQAAVHGASPGDLPTARRVLRKLLAVETQDKEWGNSFLSEKPERWPLSGSLTSGRRENLLEVLKQGFSKDGLQRHAGGINARNRSLAVDLSGPASAGLVLAVDALGNPELIPRLLAECPELSFLGPVPAVEQQPAEPVSATLTLVERRRDEHLEVFAGRARYLDTLASALRETPGWHAMVAPAERGKSSICAALSQRLSWLGNPAVPCLYVCGEVFPRRGLTPVLEVLREQAAMSPGGAGYEDFERALHGLARSHGGAVVILDGLDDCVVNAGEIDRLPVILPRGVTVLVSIRSGPVAGSFLCSKRVVRSQWDVPDIDREDVAAILGRAGADDAALVDAVWEQYGSDPREVAALARRLRQGERVDPSALPTRPAVHQYRVTALQQRPDLMLPLAILEPAGPVTVGSLVRAASVLGTPVTEDDIIGAVRGNLAGHLRLSPDGFLSFIHGGDARLARREAFSTPDALRALRALALNLVEDDAITGADSWRAFHGWGSAFDHLGAAAERALDDALARLCERSTLDRLTDFGEAAGGRWRALDPWGAKALRAASERGSGRASTILGIAHLVGLGVEMDRAEALRVLRAARNAGHVDGALLLAGALAEGESAERDEGRAVAEGMVPHHPEAYSVLALIALTEGDEDRATAALTAAWEVSDSPGEGGMERWALDLWRMRFRAGEEEQRAGWLALLAAAEGSLNAAVVAASLIVRALQPEQKALEAAAAPAVSGTWSVSPSLRLAGRLAHLAVCPNPDAATAVDILEGALSSIEREELGALPVAALTLGALAQLTKDVHARGRAVESLRLLAGYRIPEAQVALADCILTGRCDPRAPDEAVELARAAASKGNRPLAWRLLAVMQGEGLGGAARDDAQAAQWAQLGWEAGDPISGGLAVRYLLRRSASVDERTDAAVFLRHALLARHDAITGALRLFRLPADEQQRLSELCRVVGEGELADELTGTAPD